MELSTVWIVEYKWRIGYRSNKWWPGIETFLSRREARKEKLRLEGDKASNNVRYRVRKYVREEPRP